MLMLKEDMCLSFMVSATCHFDPLERQQAFLFYIP